MAERSRYNRPANPKAPRIDREKTCPFLVRVFVRAQGHNQDTDYTIDRVPPSEEHQLYTWRDSTLRELLLLLRDVAPPLRTSPLARYSLRLVFYDAQRSSYASRDLGTLSVADVLSPSPLGRADKTLEEARFVVGDYIDVAFMPGPPAVGAVEAGRGGFTRDPVPHFGREGRGGPPSRGALVGGRGGFGGPARGGFGGPPARGGFGGVQERRGDTWAPQAPTGAWGRAVAGGGREEEMRKPAHQGWGARRESKDERAPERRRDSRSRSPVRRRSRSPVGRAKEVDVEMK